MITSFTWFRRRREWRCANPLTGVRVSDRQERVPGWDQARLARAKVLLVGAGGLGGELGAGMVRKGIGILLIADPGVVDPPDLNRQLFELRSLFRNKAVEGCRLLSRRGFLGTKLIAYPLTVQDLDLTQLRPDVVVCAVDNLIPSTRKELSATCHRLKILCVFTAVSTDADHGYVFIQVPDGACWACAFRPEAVTQPATVGCPGVPATIDILKLISGIGLYAVDTLLMDRQRDWNYRSVSLGRGGFGAGLIVARRIDCPVCGG